MFRHFFMQTASNGLCQTSLRPAVSIITAGWRCDILHQFVPVSGRLLTTPLPSAVDLLRLVFCWLLFDMPVQELVIIGCINRKAQVASTKVTQRETETGRDQCSSGKSHLARDLSFLIGTNAPVAPFGTSVICECTTSLRRHAPVLSCYFSFSFLFFSFVCYFFFSFPVLLQHFPSSTCKHVRFLPQLDFTRCDDKSSW
jgi:hypothetical protein